MPDFTPDSMPALANKIALVTGASRGIGRAAARSLARQGAHVLVHYGRSRDEAESLASEIHAAGGQSQLVSADLEADDGAHILAAQVRKIVNGKLDILVANAGVTKSAAIEDITVADFNRLFAVNVRAPYFLLQQLLPVLGDGSAVIFVSSAAARAAVGTIAAYAATKGALDTLVRHFAAALGPRGIRVNAIAPGVVDTDMSSFTHSDAGRQRVLSMQALQRIATPDDIGAVFSFLASDAARWITGQTIYVDGGTKL
jgi:NAD(P)-dependent dehydrogenase (short-subunit alcohol dehydrogenase family)